jgi:hypothetical protein
MRHYESQNELAKNRFRTDAEIPTSTGAVDCKELADRFVAVAQGLRVEWSA